MNEGKLGQFTREKEIIQQTSAPSQPWNVHTFGIFNLWQHGKRTQYALFTGVSVDI